LFRVKPGTRYLCSPVFTGNVYTWL